MFKQIKNTNDKGFTIVELLVVIVVIGILAAITIVSYTGVTTRAKAAQAQANAVSVQSVAEAYNADLGYYPRATGNFTAPPATVVTKLPAGLSIITADPTSANGQTSVRWDFCGTVASPTAGNEIGGRITYYDFGTSTLKRIYLGSGSSTNEPANAATATCLAWAQ